ARAVNAARDSAWTADGVVSDRWAPVSPVTGALDAFRWRVPVEAIDQPAGALLSAKLGALIGFAAGEPALAHPTPSTPNSAFPGNATVEPIEARPAPADTSPGGKTIAPMSVAARVEPNATATATRSRVAPTDPEDADDLKERIRLAAQRAIAASVAAAPTPENSAAANSARAAKPGALPRQPHTIEPKTIEPKVTEPKTVEPQTVEPKTVEPKTVEPKTVEPKTEPKIFVSPRAPDDPGLEPDPKSRAADAGFALESSRSRVAKS